MWVADMKGKARGQTSHMSGLSAFYFMLLLLLDATGISTWAPMTSEESRTKEKPETENKLDSQTECA